MFHVFNPVNNLLGSLEGRGDIDILAEPRFENGSWLSLPEYQSDGVKAT